MASCSIINENTKEPIPFFRNEKGDFYDSFKEALSNSSEGETMSIVFINSENTDNVKTIDEFEASQADFVGMNGKYKANNPKVIFEVATLPITFDVNTTEGWINKMIQDDLLSDVVETSNGERVFTPVGETIEAKKVNLFDVEQELKAKFGREGYQKIGVSFIIKGIPKTEYTLKNGKKVSEVKDVSLLTDEEQARWWAMDGISNWWQENEKIKPKLKPTNDTEQSLSDAISNFLSTTGISVMGMKQYKEKYKAKFGNYPTADGLADIANKVIALQDGAEVSEDVLTEEVAHFIVEGMNQEEVIPLLEDVVNTEEYRIYAERYRAVYSEQYSTPQEVENAVRREILGKSLAKSIQKSFTPNVTEQGFFTNLWNAFINYYNKLVGRATPNNSKRISDFNSRVATLLKNRELSEYIDFSNSTISTPMYALSENSEFYKIWKETDTILKNVANKENLKNLRDVNNTYAEKIDRLEKTFSEIGDSPNSLPAILNGMSIFSGVFQTQVRSLLASLEGKQEGYVLTADETQSYNVLKTMLYSPLSEIFSKLRRERRDMVDSDPNSVLVDKQLTAMGNMLQDYVDLDGLYNSRVASSGDKIMRDIFSKSNRGHEQDFKDKIESWINGTFKDSSWLMTYFGQTIRSSIPQLVAIGKMAMDMFEKVSNKFQSATSEHLPILSKLAKRLPSIIDESGSHLLHHVDSLAIRKEYSEAILPIIENNLFGQTLSEKEKEELYELNYSAKKIEEIAIAKQYENATKVWESLKGKPNAEQELLDQTGFEVSNDTLVPIDSTRLSESLNKIAFEKDEASAKLKGERGKRTLRKIELFKKLGLSNDTYNLLNSLTKDRSTLNGKKVENSMGFVDPNNVINKRLELEEDEIKARRNIAKSFYSEDGNLKEGLVVSNNKKGIKVSENLYIEYVDGGNSTRDAKIAYDLHLYDGFSRSERERAEKMLKDGENVDKIAKDTNWRYENGAWREEEPIFEEGSIETLLNELEEYRRNYGSSNVKATNKAVYQFFKRHGSLSFVNDFFTNSTNTPSVREVLERNKKNMSASEYEDLDFLLTDLAEKQTKLKERLRLIQTSYDFRELDEAKLSLVERDDIKQLNNDVTNAYSELNQAIAEVEETYPLMEKLSQRLFNSTTSERDVNVSFLNKFKNETNKDWNKVADTEKTIFLRKEISDERVNDKFDTFTKIITERANETPSQKQRREDIWEQYGIESNDDIASAQVAYLVAKLPPYHKRTAPKGYSDMITNLEMDGTFNGMSIEEIIKKGGVIDGVEPRASYVFREQSDDEYYRQDERLFEEEINQANLISNKNEKLLAKYKAYLRVAGGDVVNVPSKHLNKKFFDFYGMKDLNSAPTKNIDLFEGMISLMELRRVGLDGNKLLGQKSIFELPQYEKTKMERLSKTMKDKGQIKQGVQSLVFFREEDEDYQSQKAVARSNNPEAIPKIPKTGIINIKTSDLSTDLYSSYTKFAHDGILYNERFNAVDRAIAVKESLQNMVFEGGKHWKKTNAYKMATNTIDSQFYGQRHLMAMNVKIGNREVDVSKIIQHFRSAVSWANLGASVPVAVTSLTTATINKATQRFVKYHLHNDSSNKANTEFLKLFGEFSSNVGKNYSNSKLDVLGQRFGLYNALERTENGMFGAKRNFLDLEKASFSIHNVANAPIAPRLLLSKLFEYRLIDGRFMNYSTYKEMQRAKGMSRKDIEKTFKEAEKANLYEFLDVVKGEVVWKTKPTINGLSGKALDEYLENTLSNVYSDINYNLGLYDGLIHQSQTTEAQRHPLASFLMLHKGWLSTSVLRMLARNQLNIQTGNFEEGVLITTFLRTFNNIVSRDANGKRKYSLKDWNKDFTEAQNANVRMATATAVQILALGALAYALLGWADDEDEKDNYVAQLSALLAVRVLGESMSSSFGVFSELYSTTDSPVVAMQTVDNFFSLLNFANMNKEVSAGQYKGDNKWTTSVFKLTAFKNLHMFEDPQHIKDVRKGFIFFNTQQNLYSPYPLLKWIREEGRDEE